MKTIIDVLEKLKVDDIVINKKFAIHTTFNDIVKFLEEEGFQRIDGSSVSKAFNTAKSKCFMLEGNDIWFADTSKEKISKKNPVFYMNCGFIYSIYSMEHDILEYIVINNKKEFLEELNKHFGWE